MTTRVVNLRLQPYDVYIGRGSKWGNPFSHKAGTKALYRVKSREEAIRKYREWILTQPELLESLSELEGKTLGCFCKPHDCHGDVLVELIRDKELVCVSLAKLKKKIAEQKSGRASEGGSPLNSERLVGVTRKNTPVQVQTPKEQYEQSYGASIGMPPIGTPEDYAQAAQVEAEIQKTMEKFPRKPAPRTATKSVADTPASEAKQAIMAPPKKKIVLPPRLQKGQAEALLKGGANVLAKPIPDGYIALGKHDVDKLMWLKAEIIKAQICSLDYETDGDPDDETTDPQDHELVGASVAYKIGMAVYLPVGHDNYGANWDKEWLVENFLKPVLEHPDVLIIAHNIKFEHQISLLLGIDMFPKTSTRKIMDTMLMVKALALPETVQETNDGWEVIVGLKPSAKALLASSDGMVHGLIHVDDIKSFKETVGKVEWEEPTGEYYKSGAKKGLPKMEKKSRYRTFNELPVDKTTIDYGCSDADWALGLYFKLLPMCEAEGLLDVLYELDVPNMMVVGEMELAGWHISREKLMGMEKVAKIALEGLEGEPETPAHATLVRELIAKWTPGADRWVGLEPLLYDALVELTSEVTGTDDEGNVIVPAGVYGMGTWRGEHVALEIKTAKPFNWGSVQHKQWLFYHVLKMDTRGIERSKTTGLPSTDAKTIDRLIDAYSGDSKFMEILKEKSKYDKILSTYVNGMLPYCRTDTDKLHTNINLVSTWRYSSKKPNLQNIPRADNDPMGIRGVFVAPIYDPNGDYSHLNPFTKPVHIITEKKLSGLTWYIGSDYSQIELKVLAWFANEKEMIKTLASGGDLHSWVAHKVFKLDCAVEEVKEKYKPFRYRAKAVNFG